MLDNLTEENIVHWRRQIDRAYQDLSEQEKESDCEWARNTKEVGSSSTCISRVMLIKFLKDIRIKKWFAGTLIIAWVQVTNLAKDVVLILA